MSIIKKIEFYVCTGGNGIYYTLRKITHRSVGQTEDVFVKNLSVSKERAMIAAENFVNQFRDAVTNNFQIILDLSPRQPLTNFWGEGKISSERLTMLRKVNDGYIPYGLHKGKFFEEIPSDYLGWACTEALTKNDPVTINVASAAFSVLMERGEVKEFADVEKLLLPKKSAGLNSDFIGLLQSRQKLTATIQYMKKDRSIQFNRDKYFYKLVVGDDVVIYSGSVYLGDVDDQVTMNATIDKHICYHNVKSTYIKRPHIL